MGFYTSRIRKTAAYGNRELLGVIIALSGDFCTVELQGGAVLYNIPFKGGNGRLRRLQQPVTLMEVSGQRVRYIITGAANVRRCSAVFVPKGGRYWRSSAASPYAGNWGEGYTWGGTI